MTETLPVCPVGAIVQGVVVISKEDFDRAIRTAVQAERAEIVKMLGGSPGGSAIFLSLSDGMFGLRETSPRPPCDGLTHGVLLNERPPYAP